MLRSKKASGKKKIIMIVVLVVVFAVIGYLFYTNFLSTEIEIGGSLSTTKSGVKITPSLKTEIDDSFLNSSPYVDLKQHGKLPVTVDRMGRTNPFRLMSSGL